MRRFEGLVGVEPGALHDPVCTIGVFDGVHRGHRKILDELGVWAGSIGGESCVLTFDRHPLTVLEGIEVPAILSLENRLVQLERHGVDATVVLDFAAVKDLGPQAFLKEMLLGRLGCRRLLLGFDSCIGKDRKGTPATLPGIGRSLGVEVRVSTPVLDERGSKVGSRYIREAIAAGDLEVAARLLGRPVAIRGTVVKGAGRGRDLGTATANIELTGQVLPPDGVYLVRVVRGAETAPGVANLGVRPTFGQEGERVLEVHVPGWAGDLYGDALEACLVRRLRGERRFESPDALKVQIAADLQALARAVASGEI